MNSKVVNEFQNKVKTQIMELNKVSKTLSVPASKHVTLFISIFTTRNSNCGKVMFSEACVSHSVHSDRVSLAPCPFQGSRVSLDLYPFWGRGRVSGDRVSGSRVGGICRVDLWYMGVGYPGARVSRGVGYLGGGYPGGGYLGAGIQRWVSGSYTLCPPPKKPTKAGGTHPTGMLSCLVTGFF